MGVIPSSYSILTGNRTNRDLGTLKTTRTVTSDSSIVSLNEYRQLLGHRSVSSPAEFVVA